jgi:stalled ribosome rescue protein Dom34
MKQTGVWLDKNKALIVTLENDTETLHTVSSDIDHYHEQDSLGNYIERNPLNIIKESGILNREKQQLKTYFKNIVSVIENTDELVIFGPAETNEKFGKELNDSYPNLSICLKGVKKADSMTDNQVRAWVRDFFDSN